MLFVPGRGGAWVGLTSYGRKMGVHGLRGGGFISVAGLGLAEGGRAVALNIGALTEHGSKLDECGSEGGMGTNAGLIHRGTEWLLGWAKM